MRREELDLVIPCAAPATALVAAPCSRLPQNPIVLRPADTSATKSKRRSAAAKRRERAVLRPSTTGRKRVRTVPDCEAALLDKVRAALSRWGELQLPIAIQLFVHAVSEWVSLLGGTGGSREVMLLDGHIEDRLNFASRPLGVLTVVHSHGSDQTSRNVDANEWQEKSVVTTHHCRVVRSESEISQALGGALGHGWLCYVHV